MLQMFYSDPPLTTKEQTENAEAKKPNSRRTMVDVSGYVLSAEWSGDTDQAARKVQFKVAYNKFDRAFSPVILKLGGFIYLYYSDDTQPYVQIFAGRIFYAKRTTNEFSFEYVAYDDMIYLAKSKVQLKFDNVTITDAIKKVCGEIGVPVADDIPQMATIVNFIADGKSCTEVFKMLSDKSWANRTEHPASGGHGEYADCPNTCAVIDAAREYNIDPKVAVAMAARESGGDDPRAIGSASPNMMQIEESSAAYYGVNDQYPDWRTDGEQNAKAGMMILSKKMEERGTTDIWEGVEAYNGGGDPGYLQKVQSNYDSVGDVGETSSASEPDNKPFVVFANLDKITAVEKGGNVVAGFVASDNTNIIKTEHGQSIEDMINRVKAVDDVGNVCQVFTVTDDVERYGVIQEIYKMQQPKAGESVDNKKAAKARLKQMTEESSLEGLGNVQCITGQSIMVQEEQLNGKFFIKSDSHKFKNNTHTMTLALEYVPDQITDPEVKEEDLATPVFKSSGAGNKKTYGSFSASGNMSIDSGMKAGWDAWGSTTMDNGTEGCVEAATKMGSYYSPFLADEANNGVVGVDQLVADAGDHVIPFDASQLEKGDVIVYGNNDHVVLSSGGTSYIGNSSGRNMTVKGSDYREMGSLYPTKIIKTSHM